MAVPEGPGLAADTKHAPRHGRSHASRKRDNAPASPPRRRTWDGADGVAVVLDMGLGAGTDLGEPPRIATKSFDCNGAGECRLCDPNLTP
ncbi:hypothetical protein Slala03_50810 [Streptomyces lavendulae subsp. lavendulae]|nr:hypothetical protein Slala03_50810 [Streptomyces lavendulae subsp. lavendulae]